MHFPFSHLDTLAQPNMLKELRFTHSIRRHENADL